MTRVMIMLAILATMLVASSCNNTMENDEIVFYPPSGAYTTSYLHVYLEAVNGEQVYFSTEGDSPDNPLSDYGYVSIDLHTFEATIIRAKTSHGKIYTAYYIKESVKK